MENLAHELIILAEKNPWVALPIFWLIYKAYTNHITSKQEALKITVSADQKVREAAAESYPSIVEAAGSIGERIAEKTADRLGNSFDKMGTSFDNIAEQMKSQNGLLETLVSGVVQTYSINRQGFDRVEGALNNMATETSGILGGVKTIKEEAVAEFGDKLKPVQQAVENLQSAVDKISNGLTEKDREFIHEEIQQSEARILERVLSASKTVLQSELTETESKEEPKHDV